MARHPLPFARRKPDRRRRPLTDAEIDRAVRGVAVRAEQVGAGLTIRVDLPAAPLLPFPATRPDPDESS